MMEVKGDSQNTSEDVPSDPINEVYMERKIGLLGAIGMVLGCIIGILSNKYIILNYRDFSCCLI